jgi:hypothetical protein
MGQGPSIDDRKAISLGLGCGRRRILIENASASSVVIIRATGYAPVLSTRQLSGSFVEMLPWNLAWAGEFVEGSAGI